MHKIEGAHVLCMNNHSVKFEYKGMKTVGVAEYTTQTLSILNRKMSKFKTAKNDNKYSRNVHKIRGAHFQCANIHYTKFGYKGTNIVGYID